MMAVIETEPGGERGGDGTRRLRSFALRLFMAVAHLFSTDAGPRPGGQRGEGAAGGPACRKDQAMSEEASGASLGVGGRAVDGTGGGRSRDGPGVERDAGKDVGKGDQTDTNGRNLPPDGGVRRREGKGERKGRRKRDRTDGMAGGKARGRDDGPEFMREMAGGLGTRLAVALLAGLGLAFSEAPNARYGLPDMYRMLLSMCSREGGESSAEGQYQRGRLLECAARLPSRTRMLDIIKSVRHDYMVRRCRNMVTRSMVRARRHGVLRHPVDVSIDMHDIPFYSRVLDMAYAVFSQYKRGTKKFNRLATLHCVVDGHRLTIGAEVATTGDGGNAPAVQRLLWRARRKGIRMSSITLDRGFHSVDVIQAVKATGIRMVMPAVKLDPVKEIIKKYDAGKREAISSHTITNSAGRSATYTLVILEREVLKKKKRAKMTPEDRKLAELHDKDARVKEHYVFATTMSLDWINGDPHRIAEFYRRRWGIENSYKSYEQMRPRTTSTDYSVRILIWFIPFLFYNIWALARFLAARRGLVRNGRPPCTLSLFTSMLLDAATIQFAECPNRRPPD